MDRESKEIVLALTKCISDYAIGQLVNVTSLAADSGITRVTAESGLSVLQASHLVFLVRPWFTNLNKRLIQGGLARQNREKATVLPWNDLSPLIGSIA